MFTKKELDALRNQLETQTDLDPSFTPETIAPALAAVTALRDIHESEYLGLYLHTDETLVDTTPVTRFTLVYELKLHRQLVKTAIENSIAGSARIYAHFGKGAARIEPGVREHRKESERYLRAFEEALSQLDF